MSLLRVVAPLASLFFFSSFAAAQVSAINCTLESWDWTFNSLSQDPCIVTAYMMATCDNGAYTLGPPVSGYSEYGAPGGSSASDLCYCNTVGYSLWSACAACQGYTWMPWSEWITNCTKTLPPSSFPNPVPSKIRVPQWALIDITDENYWSANQSYAVGDSPEVGPGSIIGPSTAGTTTSSSHPSSTGSPTTASSGGGSSNTGAIVGGVIGGIAAICIAVAAVLYRRRRSQAQPADAAVSDRLLAQPEAGSPTTMRLYDPNDASTFPGYQAGQHSLPSQATMSSNFGSGNVVANAQTMQPHAGGYHGHPIV